MYPELWPNKTKWDKFINYWTKNHRNMRRLTFLYQVLVFILSITVVAPPAEWTAFSVFVSWMIGFTILSVIPTTILFLFILFTELGYFPYEAYHYWWTKKRKEIPYVTYRYREWKANRFRDLEEEEIDRKLAEMRRRWAEDSARKAVIAKQRKIARAARRGEIIQSIIKRLTK